MEVILLTEEQEQPVKKPVTYEPVQEVEVSVECGYSSQESINYEPKEEASIFIEKGNDKTKNK